MSALPSNSHRFLGRQAIFDEKMRLYGYELLFRSGTDNVYSGDLEDATNRTIDSCLSMVSCSSCKNLFINCTRDALVSMSVKLLPSRTVVLEILESVVADRSLVRCFRSPATWRRHTVRCMSGIKHPCVQSTWTSPATKVSLGLDEWKKQPRYPLADWPFDLPLYRCWRTDDIERSPQWKCASGLHRIR